MPEAGAGASAGEACAWQAQEHGGRQLCTPGFFYFPPFRHAPYPVVNAMIPS